MMDSLFTNLLIEWSCLVERQCFVVHVSTFRLEKEELVDRKKKLLVCSVTDNSLMFNAKTVALSRNK